MTTIQTGPTEANTERVIRSPEPSAPATSGGLLPFFPGLEGLRGLAVAVVLVFHGGFALAQGGFLGVSTFFTLSGFLITSLLLAEHDRTDTVDLRAFWSHRFRRLLPAALAALVLVVVVGAVAADATQRQHLGGDLIGAVAYVANWRFVLSGQSYGDLFSAPSPVLHFWSLAIEEQFYLVYPFVVYVLLRVLGWSRRRFALVLGILLAGSLALSLFGGFSIDRIYYGTDTRAAELLIGALLAVALSGPGLARMASGRIPGARLLAGAGGVALAVMALAWITTSHDAGWLYHGGFALYGLVSMVLLASALLPTGPTAALFGWAPLRGLGRISYGVYLYHWPIFLWLSETNTDLHGLALWTYQVGVTVAVAWLSYRYLEMPIRQGRPLLPGRFGALPIVRAGVVAAVTVVVGGILITVTAPPIVNDFAAAQQQLDAVSKRSVVAAPRAATTVAPVASKARGRARSGAGAGTGAAPAATLPADPRVAIFGDSTMLTTGLGLGDVLTADGTAQPVGGQTDLGCGLGRGGERRSGGAVESIPDRCDQWPTTWGDSIDALRPDVAVVQEGVWDAAERRLPGETAWRAPGDPVYDTFLLGEMNAAVDVLTAHGAHVVWLTSPHVNENVRRSGQPEIELVDHPERIDRFNELIGQVAAARPEAVTVVDLAGWLAASGDDLTLRPDGVHLGDDASHEVARRWLAAAVLRAAGAA